MRRERESGNVRSFGLEGNIYLCLIAHKGALAFHDRLVSSCRHSCPIIFTSLDE